MASADEEQQEAERRARLRQTTAFTALTDASSPVEPEPERVVVTLGIMLLDYSVALPALPTEDSKQRADDQWVGGGGNGANTATVRGV